MKVLGAGGWGLAAVVMGLLAPPLARAQSADDTVRKQLAGEWTLVKYEVFTENGQARPGNYDIGRINYGEHEMSAHLMRSGRPKEPAGTEGARAAAFQGYLGYFGPYTIDAAKKTVVHH